MGRSEFRIAARMDTADVRKGSQEVIRDVQKVSKEAEQASARAASSGVKALSSILRMVESGKVSAKGIDKIGKSASGALSLMSPIGVALGLGAVPALSDGVVFAIGAIKKSLTPLSQRISDVAHALDTLNQAQLDLVDSQLGIIDANKGLADSLTEVDKAQKDAATAAADADAARKGRIVDTAKVTKLTEQHHNALRAVTAAEISATGAQRHLDDAVKKHGATSSQASDASDRLAKAALRVTGAKEKERSVLRELDQERKGHKATDAEVAKLTDKQTAATEKAKTAALAAAHAQAEVTKADNAQQTAKAAVAKSTGDFQSKLKSLTETADANNLTMQHAGGRMTSLGVDTKSAAADVSKGLRDWANSQSGLSQATKDGAIAAADLIDKTHKIPKDITTTFSQPGQKEANKATDLYQRLLGKIDPSVSTTVKAPGLNRALGDAKGLFGALQLLDGKTVNTYVIGHRRGSFYGDSPSGTGLATGGRIGGSPNNRDDVNVNVSQGEVILNPRQQAMVDGGMTIDQALAATAAPTITMGGWFAGGGKSAKKKPHHSLAYRKAQVALEAAKKRLRDAEKKHGKGSLEYRQAQVAVDNAQAALAKARGAEKHHATEVLQDRNQGVLDRAKDAFGLTMSSDDLALAKAESTPGTKDDNVVLQREAAHINKRIKDIRALRRRRGLTRGQKQDLNQEEADLLRQLVDISGQQNGAPPDDPGQDPYAIDRARQEGYNAGAGRLDGYVFGGTGDIGSGGANALQAAGSIPAIHVETLTLTNSVQNQGQIARAANVGNDVISAARVRSLRQRVTF